MQAFMYTVIGITDGAHIGFFLSEMLEGVIFKVFDALFAGMVLFCGVFIEKDKLVYDRKKSLMRFVNTFYTYI